MANSGFPPSHVCFAFDFFSSKDLIRCNSRECFSPYVIKNTTLAPPIRAKRQDKNELHILNQKAQSESLRSSVCDKLQMDMNQASIYIDR